MTLHTTKPKWPIVIRTKRLVLRPYETTDFPAWVTAFSSRAPARDPFDSGPPDPKLLNRKRFQEMRLVHRRLARADSGYVLGIFDSRTGAVLGWTDLYIFDRASVQSANFGYLLHNPYWGKGYGFEAAHALALAAFKHLKLHRLEATISPGNHRSQKLIRRLGFRPEGLRKKCDWDNGTWKDDLVFSATPDDFGLPMRAPSVRRAW